MKALWFWALLLSAIVAVTWWAWTRSMLVRRYRVKRLWRQMRQLVAQYLGDQLSTEDAVSRMAHLLYQNHRLPSDLETGPEDLHDLAPPGLGGDQRIADLQGQAAELYRKLYDRSGAA